MADSPINLNSIDIGGMSNFLMIGVLIMFLIIVIAIIMLKIMDFLSYNIEVVIKRQVGEATFKDGKKFIPCHQFITKGKIYNKKINKDTFVEYFKIKGSNFDYRNYMPDESFYTKEKVGLLDISKKGITLLFSKNGALIPLSVSNPSFIDTGVNVNDIISAISDSMKERDEYQVDFWAKWGTLITIGLLIAFLVVGMIFVIKYQEVFWSNSMAQLQSILQTMKDTARPELPVTPGAPA